MFAFKCSTCGLIHDGIPTFSWDYPIYYLSVPEDEREQRCELTSDTCVVDNEFFFVRGCVEIHVQNETDPFIWGVWVSLSETNFRKFRELFEVEERDHEGPYFGWISAEIKIYPSTENLKALVHLRNNGMRPYVELEPTDHPLALEERHGITRERLIEICELMMH
jgi:hypothetical protein